MVRTVQAVAQGLGGLTVVAQKHFLLSGTKGGFDRCEVGKNFRAQSA